MRRISIDTVGAMIDYGNTLTVYCLATGCGHKTELDLQALAARLGRGHGSLHKDLAPKLVCSKCGARKIRLNRQPRGLPRR